MVKWVIFRKMFLRQIMLCTFASGSSGRETESEQKKNSYKSEEKSYEIKRELKVLCYKAHSVGIFLAKTYIHIILVWSDMQKMAFFPD